MESDPRFQESSDQVVNQLGPHLEDWQTTNGKAAQLKSAANSGNWTLVSDLLAEDDVTRCDIEVCFLLHQLATTPEVSLSLVRDIKKKILKRKVNINIVDNNDDTAVMLAARRDNMKMLTELLSRKAELPQDDEKLCSFLQTLTENWKQEETPYLHALVVKQLWDSLKEKALHGRLKAIHKALVKLAVTFHPSLLREMFQTRLQLNSLDSEGMAVLHRVAMFSDDDHVRLVPFLVSRGADVNLQNSSGDTPLHVAAKQNKWTMVETFLRRRADSGLLDSEQRSVLHIVAACGEHESFPKIDNILQLLLRNCKDLNLKDQQGNTALHLAAYAGNMTLVEELLHRGARVDTVNHQQKTVLHAMSVVKQTGYPDNTDSYDRILLLAIKKGLDVHKIDSDRNSAMHLAARHENWTLVKCLLKHVDDISEPESEGLNVLHRFAMSSPSSYNEDLFYRLYQKTSDINKKSQKGDASVHLAAGSQNWQIVKQLVEAGAMTNELDSEGFHVLHRLAMAENGDSGMQSLQSLRSLQSIILETTMNNNPRSLAGDSALHLAAKHANWSMVEHFVDLGEDVDEKDSEGLTVLQRLVMSTADRYSSHFALFCRLLDAGADYTCRDHNGNTVLHLAARNSHWKMVGYLLQLGESPDIPDSDGCVLLHRAAVAEREESSAKDVLDSVLKNKPVLDARTKLGDTAIQLAARHERWETVKILMEHGANVFDCDSDNTSVLQRIIRSPSSSHCALTALQTTVQKNFTEQYSSIYETLLYDAANYGKWEIAKCLVNEGVRVLQLNAEGLSLLHVIASSKVPKYTFGGVNDLIKCLLHKAIALEDKSPDGNTALNLAAKHDNWDVVKSLVEQGANINSPDSEGIFVIQRLAICKDFQNDHLGLTRHLIKNGADVRVFNSTGDSLLHLGARANNWSFVFEVIQEADDLDINAIDSEGFNILQRLCQYPADASLQWFERFSKKGLTFNMDVTDSHGNTFLLLAAIQRNWNFIRCLLGKVLNRESPDTVFTYPSILWPVRFSIKASPGFALGHDTKAAIKNSLDKKNWLGFTLWHLAVFEKQWDVIRDLVECGAETNHIDDETLSILHRMASDEPETSQRAKEDKKQILKLLKNKRSSVAIKDGLENTPLQVAARNKNLQFVALLLDSADNVRCKDSDGFSLLHRVFQISSDSSDLEKIAECLVRSGADMEEMSWDGNKPIHVAARNSEWLLVIILLKHGARASTCDSEGLSVLHRLANQGQTELTVLPTPFGPRLVYMTPASLVKDVICAGASVLQKDLQGNTPLHFAVQHKNWRIAEELVQCGADVNELDYGGCTVLHRLAQVHNPNQSFLSLTRLLLEKRARCDTVSKSCGNILDTAVDHQNWLFLTCFLTLGMPEHEEDKAKSLLHSLACSKLGDKRTDVCDLLIKKGVPVDAEDSDGNTALHLAARASNWNMVRHLLKKGVTAKTLDSEGMSVLHRYVTSVQTERVSYELNAIVSSDVNINALDPQGNTAIHIAAKRKLTGIVHCLLENVGDLNIKDSDGFTVLQRLAQTPSSSCLSVCKDLVRKGADVDLCSMDGESALQLALRSNNWPVVDLLLTSGAHFQVPELEKLQVLHKIIKCPNSILPDDNQLTLVKLLTTIGMSTSVKDLSGKTPLEIAFTHQKWAIATYLVECGSSFGDSPLKKNTFFHDLARMRSSRDKVTDITVLMTKCGLDINLPNNVGDNPVHVAANNDNWDIVQTFVEHGANTNIPDRRGYSLVHKLVRSDRQMGYNKSLFNAIKTMVKYGAEINLPTPDSKTTLQIAVAKGDWELAGCLIEVGSAYKLSQEEKKSVFNNLQRLVWGDVEVDKLKLFISYITNEGSEINRHLQTEYGYGEPQTVFDRCVGNCKWNLAKALAQCGAEMGGKYNNKTLLQFMITRYSSSDRTAWVSFLDTLISKGLDINVSIEDGSGVLFADATMSSLIKEESDDSSLFDTLLAKGANPLLVDSRGQSLLRKVVEYGGQKTVNGLRRLLSAGVTTHQPRLTEAAAQQQTVSARASLTASPTEKVIQDRNIEALKVLIESGANSNNELFRLNTDYQVKLSGCDDPLVRELLDILHMAASQPRSLQSLCRLTVSHVLGCGPDRQDRIKRLPVPTSSTDFISFRDVFSTEYFQKKRDEARSVSWEYVDTDSEYDYASDDYYYETGENDVFNALHLLRRGLDSDSDPDF